MDNIRNIIVAKDVGISHALTVGNEAMIDVVDCMNYLVDNDDCRVIALFMESIRDPQAFMDAARRAFEAGKPVVACKIGRSERGKRAAEAHTGGLAADDRVVDAVFRQLGVIRVDSVEDLLITAAALDGYGELSGDRVAFLTGSGAACGMICDLAEKHRIELSDLSEGTRRKLRDEILPPFAAAQNPLDFTAYAVMDPSLPPNAMRALAADENTDIVVHVTANLPQEESPHTALMDQAVQRMVGVYNESPKPFVHMDFFSIDYTPYARAYRERHGLPFVLPSIEKGVPALARALWWSRRRREGLGIASQEPDAAAVAGGTGAWSEAVARDYLAGQGVPVAPARLAATAEEAVAAARETGGPVAMKLVSAQIAHKSDIGGVRLGVDGDDAVRDAFVAIVAAGGSVPGAVVDGVLVSPMRTGGVEMLVGVVRDPHWGPVLAIGLGGVFVEILGDSALRVLPVSREEIGRMIDELAGRPLLDGARGLKPANRDRLIAVIAAIADAAWRLGDRLEALEVNPLRVDGDEVEALDALISWRAEGPVNVQEEEHLA
ncbi:MAG: acetate--CoA ligase family protein [Novosphingobium sp.]|nr:acetate--CoA ligase family protein [Novosphingobium sp.]